LALMVLLPASYWAAASTARREGPRVALENISATIFGVAILVTLTVGALLRARTLHRKYWATRKHRTVSSSATVSPFLAENVWRHPVHRLNARWKGAGL